MISCGRMNNLKISHLWSVNSVTTLFPMWYKKEPPFCKISCMHFVTFYESCSEGWNISELCVLIEGCCECGNLSSHTIRPNASLLNLYYFNYIDMHFKYMAHYWNNCKYIIMHKIKETMESSHVPSLLRIKHLKEVYWHSYKEFYHRNKGRIKIKTNNQTKRNIGGWEE